MTEPITVDNTANTSTSVIVMEVVSDISTPDDIFYPGAFGINCNSNCMLRYWRSMGITGGNSFPSPIIEVSARSEAILNVTLGTTQLKVWTFNSKSSTWNTQANAEINKGRCIIPRIETEGKK